jgi:hypothetical protein
MSGNFHFSFPKQAPKRESGKGTKAKNWEPTGHWQWSGSLVLRVLVWDLWILRTRTTQTSSNENVDFTISGSLSQSPVAGEQGPVAYKPGFLSWPHLFQRKGSPRNRTDITQCVQDLCNWVIVSSKGSRPRPGRVGLKLRIGFLRTGSVLVSGVGLGLLGWAGGPSCSGEGMEALKGPPIWAGSHRAPVRKKKISRILFCAVGQASRRCFMYMS